MHEFRTHTCGELNREHVGQKVRLSGWMHHRRHHGHMLFIDLRDHYGITQVVVYDNASFQYDVGHLARESVIRVDGEVVYRTGNVNSEMETGDIEITAENIEVLGKCDEVPFSVFREEDVKKELRLKYRYIDLRRQEMHDNIILRSRIITAMRKIMTEMKFQEFQTPILTSSSPEGARDYLVPSREHPGKFYALPQAPQIFKQLFMISGFDRYFQVAPCFRDEDARADRSPGEFYQLDIEMAFATQDDVFSVVEKLLYELFTRFSACKCDKPPFVRIPYKEAMLKYGTDKPDLRIPIEIRDVSSVFAESEFRAFRGVVEKGGVVRAVPAKGAGGKSRKFFDKMEEHAKKSGAKGLAYISWADDKIKGPLTRFLTDGQINRLSELCGTKKGDAVFFAADTSAKAAGISGAVRNRLGEELDLIDKDEFRFCWIVDFPMYEYDEENKKIEFSHNPFSMPQGGPEVLETEKDSLNILAYQYDIVCNGIELSSGAIRNHRPDVMYKAFEIAGYDSSVVDRKFGSLINAFKMGAPPHGGIAPGIDRIVMLLAGASTIQEVIAFPMNMNAQDLMMNAPSEVTPEQLRELHLKIIKD